MKKFKEPQLLEDWLINDFDSITADNEDKNSIIQTKENIIIDDLDVSLHFFLNFFILKNLIHY